MNKRTSILPKHTALFIDPSALIAQHAGFTGTHPITVGPNAVLHPHAKVSSAQAPVVIGENVVLWERVKIGVGMADSMDESKRNSVASMASRTSVRSSTRGEGTVLGRNVTVEATAVVEAAEVGEGSVIEVGAYLGKGCVIGKASCGYQTEVEKLTVTVLYSRRALHSTIQHAHPGLYGGTQRD